MVTAGLFPSNSYIYASGRAGEAVLIDVGLDPEPLDAALHELGLTPSAVYCTHGHFDHLGSARFFQNRYGAPVYLHRADLKAARMNNFMLMAMKLAVRIELPDLTPVEDDFTAEVGDATLTYRHSPGHTPGSCVLRVGEHLFTGDTLYSYGVGLSKLPGEQPEVLKRTIASLWDSLDDLTIHPGHGPSSAGSSIRTDNLPLLSFLSVSATTTSAIHA